MWLEELTLDVGRCSGGGGRGGGKKHSCSVRAYLEQGVQVAYPTSFQQSTLHPLPREAVLPGPPP